MHFIYKITNTTNNKIYIGQTKRSVSRRFSEHRTSQECTALARSIAKYGIDNFVIGSLVGCSTQEELDSFESALITCFRATDKKNGYNLTTGGDRPIYSAETIRRRSAVRRGLRHKRHVEHRANFGRPLSEFHRQRLREGWKKNPEIAALRRERNKRNAILGAMARWKKNGQPV